MATTEAPLRLSAETLSVELPLNTESTPWLQDLDAQCMAAMQANNPLGHHWQPLIQEFQETVKVMLVLEGPSATKMTVMDGTRVLAHGKGAQFVDRNARFFNPYPEIDIRLKPWFAGPQCGLKLEAKTVIFRI